MQKVTKKEEETSKDENYRHKFTEEDENKKRDALRLRHELKRMQDIRKAYMDKLRDDLEIQQMKYDIEELQNTDKEDTADFLFKQAMSKILGTNSPIVMNAQQTSDLNEFEKDLNTKINTEEEAQPVGQSRFTEEQMKESINKIMTPDQKRIIKELSEEEVLQLYDAIRDEK